MFAKSFTNTYEVMPFVIYRQLDSVLYPNNHIVKSSNIIVKRCLVLVGTLLYYMYANSLNS